MNITNNKGTLEYMSSCLKAMKLSIYDSLFALKSDLILQSLKIVFNLNHFFKSVLSFKFFSKHQFFDYQEIAHILP